MKGLLLTGFLLTAGLSQAMAVEDRYALVPTEEGALRIDRESGEVSRCESDGTVCRLLPDERLAYEREIERLADRVDALEERLAVLETAGPRGLPDEEDLDRALDLTERTLRRFFGMMRELGRDTEPERLGRNLEPERL